METPLDQNISPKPTNYLGKVVLFNFGFMFLFMLFSGSGTGDDGMMGLFLDSMLVLAQTGLNFLGGLILLFTKAKEWGRAMMIAGLLIGIIGFGACFGKHTVFSS